MLVKTDSKESLFELSNEITGMRITHPGYSRNKDKREVNNQTGKNKKSA